MGSAAFLNESMILEIITGRYLKQDVSNLRRRAVVEFKTYTRTPLIVEQSVMSVLLFGENCEDLRSRKKFEWWLERCTLGVIGVTWGRGMAALTGAKATASPNER